MGDGQAATTTATGGVHQTTGFDAQTKISEGKGKRDRSPHGMWNCTVWERKRDACRAPALGKHIKPDSRREGAPWNKDKQEWDENTED